MKMLILNSVPQNTGDAALLEALLYGIELNTPNVEITLSVKRNENIPSTFQQYTIITDYAESKFISQSPFNQLVLNKTLYVLRKLKLRKWVSKKPFWKSNQQKQYETIVKNSDVVILCPGGYFHDFYETGERFYLLKKIISWQIPIYLIGQSVGPFWQEKTIKSVQEIFPKLAIILLREEISKQHLSFVKNISPIVSQDFAFLLAHKYPALFIEKTNKKITNVGMTFRNWANDGEEIIEKARKFIHFLTETYQINITFISTCQGLPNYVDDAQFNTQILENQNIKTKVLVDKNHYTAKQLIEKLGTFDAVISMRLHGCILSMLAGTPSFCIGYEDKSEGIFNSLQLSEYHVNYTMEMEDWIKKTQKFFEDYPSLTKDLKQKVETASNQVAESINMVSVKWNNLKTKL